MLPNVKKYEIDISNLLSAGGTSRLFLLILSLPQIKGYILFFQHFELLTV